MTNSTTEQRNDVAKTLGLDDSSARKSGRKRWWLWGGLVLAVLVAGIIWVAKGKTAAVQYVTQPVRRGHRHSPTDQESGGWDRGLWHDQDR
jgi:cytochrome c-type biogenesis protein CcmH/NrfG